MSDTTRNSPTAHSNACTNNGPTSLTYDCTCDDDATHGYYLANDGVNQGSCVGDGCETCLPCKCHGSDATYAGGQCDTYCKSGRGFANHVVVPAEPEPTCANQ